LVAVALLGGEIYGWFLLQRKLHGEDGGDEANELEAFIAAWREGKVDPTMPTQCQALTKPLPGSGLQKQP
jgi:hypothetical protein